MDLDQKAAKLSNVRWKSDHASFIADCPNDAGHHMLAVSKLSYKCLDGCAKELLDKFFANGNGKNGHVEEHPKERKPNDIYDWQYKLSFVAKNTLTNPKLGTYLQNESRDKLHEGLIGTLKEASQLDENLPPADLTPIEIEEMLDALARQCLDQYLPEHLPARTDDFLPEIQDPDANLPAVNYDDRLAVDAYEAYAQMKGDLRGYCWEGLIRDGCTAVLSALIGSGKSTLAMNAARAWGLGVPFLDRECRQSRTLVVVSPKEYEAWAETIGFWELKGAVFLVESTKAHFGKREETVAWFDFLMKKHECRTFVLDTLFDFFGMPPNTSGDSNRIAMNEQTPLLQLVRERNYAGLVTGHAPKSEAKAIDPRDPEESFGGHTAWTAQHRMRMTIRRKSQGINAFITGRGGYGDAGVLKEQLLLFDEGSRLDSLGGLFADHLGRVAMPSVVECLTQLGRPSAISQLVKEMDKGEKWIRPGLKEARKQGVVVVEGKGRSTRYRLATQEADQGDLPISDSNPTYQS